LNALKNGHTLNKITNFNKLIINYFRNRKYNMEPIQGFHQLDPNNPYSTVGSASYSPTTAPPSPPAMNFRPIQPPIQSNLFNSPPAPPVSPMSTSISNTIINPPIYDGSTDPSLWLREYELIANANNWNDNLKIKRLIGSLTGSPRLYYMYAMEGNPNLTWYDFRIGLIQRYTNTNDNDSSITYLYGRKQNVNESFNDYWYSKLQLIETKRPNLPIEDKKQLLLEGLLPYLRDKVMEQLIVRPTGNLEEIRTIAKQLSDLSMHGNPPIQNYYQRQRRVGGYAYMANANYNFGYHRRNRHTQTDDGTVNIQNHNPGNTRREIVCLACQEIGHYARSCPVRRQSRN
jgi:hypothetical protein